MRVVYSPFGAGAAFIVCLSAFAQQPGPALSIDAGAGRHAISPDIYGINFYWDSGTGASAAIDLRPTARRWGGNGTSTYQWKFDVSSTAADWFYEVLPDNKVNASKLPDGSSFNQFADQVRTTGGKMMGTIPVLDWLPKSRSRMCSYSTLIYGPQCKVDYWWQSCGNGIKYATECGDPPTNDGKTANSPVYINNDPSQVYAQFPASLQEDWIKYLITRYGKGNQGGIEIWSLDNEPIWWDSTHRDIHPDPYTYDELLEKNVRYAEAIKRADPTAAVSGPVADNWSSIWMSKKDILDGIASGNWFANPTDRARHGDIPLMAWFLQQMRQYEQTHGFRLLDYYDHHAYLPIAGDSSQDTAEERINRFEATRAFWDPTYVIGWDWWMKDPATGQPATPQFIPRLKKIIADNYPGTKLALTEYNLGRFDTLNGGLAQADLLGIFGREGLDLATLWGQPKPTDPAAFAFKLYRNYDGIGGTFGETGVQAASEDQGRLAVYAAERSDSNLTVVVINKTTGDLSSTINLANFTPGPSAKVWRYSGSNLGAIAPGDDVAIGGSSFSATFPGYSATMIVIPPASYTGPKPKVSAVTSAASYEQVVAPGQMVVIWGENMGPQDLAMSQWDDRGMVAKALAGTRVLFDGVPAPIVYTAAGQCAVVVPYFGAVKATTHVQDPTMCLPQSSGCRAARSSPTGRTLRMTLRPRRSSQTTRAGKVRQRPTTRTGSRVIR